MIETAGPVLVAAGALYLWRGEGVITRIEEDTGPIGGPDRTPVAVAARGLAIALWPVVWVGKFLGFAAAAIEGPEPEDDGPPVLGSPERLRPPYTPPEGHPALRDPYTDQQGDQRA